MILLITYVKLSSTSSTKNKGGENNIKVFCSEKKKNERKKRFHMLSSIGAGRRKMKAGPNREKGRKKKKKDRL